MYASVTKPNSRKYGVADETLQDLIFLEHTPFEEKVIGRHQRTDHDERQDIPPGAAIATQERNREDRDQRVHRVR